MTFHEIVEETISELVVEKGYDIPKKFDFKMEEALFSALRDEKKLAKTCNRIIYRFPLGDSIFHIGIRSELDPDEIVEEPLH